MQKILLAIDAINPDRNTFEFACFLGRLTKSKVTGVFLENIQDEQRPVLKETHVMPVMDWEIDENSEEHQAKMKIIEGNIASFKEGSICQGVKYQLHRDRGIPVHELVEESRFADLLVIDAETSFNRRFEGTPTEFVRDILKKAECPVIIAPESFEAIDEIVVAYNGSSSAVFALKQFTYLFPQLNTKKITILQVTESGEWHGTDKYKLLEWLKDHYTDFHLEVQKGDTDSRLFDYLFKKTNSLLVIGAYGRNELSRFLKRSHADILIKTVTQPIFIAHL
jgi:nucleotide-binding universal stress UspA family protein